MKTVISTTSSTTGTTTNNRQPLLTRLSKSLAVAGLLSLSAAVHADSLAIVNATIHTASTQGVLQQASIIVEDGIITAINPAQITADKTINAQGKILTPGFIAAFSQLGLVEVGAVKGSVDASDEKADITFDPGLAFNPQTSAIPYARKGGITHSIITPRSGKSIFAGQSSLVNLSGDFDSVVNANNAVLVTLGVKSKGSRALDLQTLTNKLDDANDKLIEAAKAKKPKKDKKDKKESKPPSREEKVLNALLKGEKTLIVSANRASDLLHLIALKQRLKLNLVISGAADAIVIAESLAKADVPVIIDATLSLPRNFDSLHASLENAGLLVKAGVKVIIGTGGAFGLKNLRHDAGIAIAYGMTATDALAAVTTNVAQAFNLDTGNIAVGKPANLVLWTADPFELSSKVDTLWIDGKQHTTDSRQDALRRRYTSKSDMPPAYTQ